MKKLFAYLAVIGILSFGVSNICRAQDNKEAAPTAKSEAAAPQAANAPATLADLTEEEGQPSMPLHQQVKAKFIEGGAAFMGLILLCFIFGLAFVIERLIYLNLATTNTKKLLNKVEEALQNGGAKAAKEVCRNTSGPVASIFYQGLDRIGEGIDVVEKSIVSYGSVQMGLLEKNLSWISLFISIAPMLGFMGTVLGMIQAFDQIRKASDMNPSIVAGPIGIALITTAGGLIIAVVLQLFYNYLLAQIDSIVNKMEDASISMIDLLVKYNIKK